MSSGAPNSAAFLTILMSIGVVGFLHGQAPSSAPMFEAASIRRNTSGSENSSRNLGGGGRMVFENVTLGGLVAAAYEIESYQLSGGPSWAESARFDVLATAGREAPLTDLNAMLRSLLADRFRLRLHDEQRDMRVYALVRSRPDGAPGPNLKRSRADCGPTGRGMTAGAPPVGCNAWLGPGTIGFEGQPIGQLAKALGMFLEQPVVDRAGLEGGYDLTLSYSPEGGRGMAAPPVGTPPAPVDPNKPSLFAALQEQLGLKLEPQHAPVRVVVIDSASLPTDN